MSGGQEKKSSERGGVCGLDRSLHKWGRRSTLLGPTTENVQGAIPMQRRSVLTVVSSCENLADDDERDVLTDNAWMAMIGSKDHKSAFKRQADAIRENVIKRGAPTAM